MVNEPDTLQPEPTYPTDRAEEQSYTQALWYAWGQEDAGIPLYHGDGFAFAVFYLRRVRRYRRGFDGMLESIQGCFAAWQSGASR